MNILLLSLILFTLVYEPIIGYFQFKKFKVNVVENPNERLIYYKKTVLGLWIPTIVILGIFTLSDFSLKDIGLTIPTINTNSLGSLATYIALGIGAGYSLVVLYYIVAYHTSKKFKAKYTEEKKKQMEGMSFSEIMPVTKEEKKWWSFVSFTAGFTEEIIYRGFLLFTIAYFLPESSIWLVALLSAAIFGLAHTYQGFVLGFLRVTAVGFVFALIAISMSSIIPLIILHFLIDYMGKLGETTSEFE